MWRLSECLRHPVKLKVKQEAECDLLIGLGKGNSPDEDKDPTRYINVMKNKISGWHGMIICNLDADRNRYGA